MSSSNIKDAISSFCGGVCCPWLFHSLSTEPSSPHNQAATITIGHVPSQRYILGVLTKLLGSVSIHSEKWDLHDTYCVDLLFSEICSQFSLCILRPSHYDLFGSYEVCFSAAISFALEDCL